MRKKGSILVLALLVTTLLLISGGTFLTLTLTNYKIITKGMEWTKAKWIATAGLNSFLHQILKHYFDPDEFATIERQYIQEIKFAGGKYRVGCVPVRGTGVHEFLILSEGTYMDESVCVGARIRLSLPSDYIYFVNGNAFFVPSDNSWPAGIRLIAGAVHVNGNLFIDAGPGGAWGWSDPTKLESEKLGINFIRALHLTGPVVSVEKLIWTTTLDVWKPEKDGGTVRYCPICRALWNQTKNTSNPQGHYWRCVKLKEHFHSPEPPMRCGIGRLKMRKTSNIWSEWEIIPEYDYGTNSNWISQNTFHMSHPFNDPKNRNNYSYIISEHHRTPDVVFPITYTDSTSEKLLLHKGHGGYHIDIPSSEEIFDSFEPFIDKKWHIKTTEDAKDLPGCQIKTFFNECMRKKQPLRRISNQIYESDVLLQEEFLPSPGESASYERWYEFYPKSPLTHAVYTPSTYWRLILNVKLNGQLLVRERDYRINWGDINYSYAHEPGWPRHWQRRIYFCQPVSRGAKVSISKMKYLYAATDESFQKFVNIPAANFDVIGNRIKFKTRYMQRPMYSASQHVFGWFHYEPIIFIKSGKYRYVSKYEYSPLPISDTLYGEHDRFGERLKFVDWVLPLEVYEKLETQEVQINEDRLSVGVGFSFGGEYNHPFTIEKKPFITKGQKIKWIGLPAIQTIKYNYTIIKSEIINDKLFIIDGETSPKFDGPAWLTIINENGEVVEPYVDENGNWAYKTNPNYRIYPWGVDGNTEGEVENWSWGGGGAENFTFNLPEAQFKADGKMVVLNVNYTGGWMRGTDVENIDGKFEEDIKKSYYHNAEIIYVDATLGTPADFGFPVVATDPLVEAVAIDLSLIPESEYPKHGVIFSEVPLVIFGVPKKKITIVCMEDVYLGNINASYYDFGGRWISCHYGWDDPRAKPVCIISAKSVFRYHGLNMPWNDYVLMEKEENYKRMWNDLNKVIVFTQSERLFEFGGYVRRCDVEHYPNDASNNINKYRFCGSYVLGNMLHITDKDKYHSYYYIDSDMLKRSYALLNESFKLSFYAESLRKELPPHTPIDKKIIDWWDISPVEGKNFLDILKYQILNFPPEERDYVSLAKLITG